MVDSILSCWREPLSLQLQHMSLLEGQVDTQARLFIGVPIPPATKALLRATLNEFPQYIEKIHPEEQWHLTLLFLGEVVNHSQYVARLKKALPQTFVPTVSLTSIGRGLQRDQLWAYVHPSTVLVSVREQLVSRLKKMRFPLPPQTYDDFVPHIRLASLYSVSRGIGLADVGLTTAFSLRDMYLYRSETTPTGAHYSVETAIPLSA